MNQKNQNQEEPIFNNDDTILTAVAKLGVIGTITGFIFTLSFPFVLMSMLVLWSIDAFVLKYLWAWFVHPVFSQMPNLSWVQCIGLIITIRYLSGYQDIINKNYKKDEKDQQVSTFLATLAGRYLLGPAVMLLSAYLFHQYIF